MSYSKVHIVNSTNYSAAGEVEYAVCKNDSYTVNADDSWTGPGRGVCLVTKITAVLSVNNVSVQAKPYTSSGTSYSQFLICSDGQGGFLVTRNTSVASDDIDRGELEPEPTEQQN